MVRALIYEKTRLKHGPRVLEEIGIHIDYINKNGHGSSPGDLSLTRWINKGWKPSNASLDADLESRLEFRSLEYGWYSFPYSK
ncbi:hypothetical protein QVD17_16437 [Tagetes erecta]|uniref:Uncharacterized protein n=1 Tax=Tagetes erecta TaxID=13708 RepID=A0AAD8NZN0_TARER|nr:hypothetical protein QVD17_16437 [Tagetes erecta]